MTRSAFATSLTTSTPRLPSTWSGSASASKCSPDRALRCFARRPAAVAQPAGRRRRGTANARWPPSGTGGLESDPARGLRPRARGRGAARGRGRASVTTSSGRGGSQILLEDPAGNPDRALPVRRRLTSPHTAGSHPANGPPARPTITPTAPAASSVARTPTRKARSATAAAASTPSCHGSARLRASGTAAPRIAPMRWAGALEERPWPGVGSQAVEVARSSTTMKRKEGAKATAAASRPPPIPPRRSRPPRRSGRRARGDLPERDRAEELPIGHPVVVVEPRRPCINGMITNPPPYDSAPTLNATQISDARSRPSPPRSPPSQDRVNAGPESGPTPGSGNDLGGTTGQQDEHEPGPSVSPRTDQGRYTNQRQLCLGHDASSPGQARPGPYRDGRDHSPRACTRTADPAWRGDPERKAQRAPGSEQAPGR